MTTEHAFALKPTIPVITVIKEQARILLYRHKYDLMLIAGVIVVFHPISLVLMEINNLPERYTEVGLGSHSFNFVFVLMSFWWAARIWSDIPIGERDPLFLLPVARRECQLIRILVGAGIWITLVIVAWLIGSFIQGVLAHELAYWPQDSVPNWNWFICVIGLLNGYLLGSVLVLLSKRPDMLLFGGLLGVLLLVLLMLLFNLYNLIDLIWQIIGGRYGMAAGFGFYDPQVAQSTIMPMPIICLLWMVLFALATFGAVSVHRKWE